jgi:hypothetical protein
MAYDTIVTQNLLGENIEVFNNSIKAPVGNTRAYVETVNQGLKQLIDNDVTLQTNKLDAIKGGSYTMDQEVEITLNPNALSGASNHLNLNIPVFINTDYDNLKLGGLHQEIGTRITPSTSLLSEIEVGSVYAMKRYYAVTPPSDGTARGKLFKVFSATTTAKGKEVTFYAEDYDTAGTDVTIEIRFYWDYDSYEATASTKYTRNKIKMGNTGFRTVTFLTDSDYYGHLALYPVSWSSNAVDGSISATHISNLYTQQFA